MPRKKPFAANRASTQMLEADGWTVCTVEQRLPHCFITKDAFGFIDLLAISPTRGILGVQATGGGNLSSRVAKIRQTPAAALWLASGGRIVVHDWRKRAKQTKRECVALEITKGDFEGNAELSDAGNQDAHNANARRSPHSLQ